MDDHQVQGSPAARAMPEAVAWCVFLRLPRLLRLPRFTILLLRCRAVCKRWRDFIDNVFPKLIDERAPESSINASALERRGLIDRAIPLDVIRSVLLLLAAPAVLRCRAVCKLWRDLVDDASFRQEYRRGRPQMPLLHLSGDDRYCLIAVDPRARATREIVCAGGRFAIHGSTEGVLLISSREGEDFLICDPMAGRWTAVPPMHPDCVVVGFYHHRASKDFKVLFSETPVICLEDDMFHPQHFVLSIGTGEIIPTVRSQDMRIGIARFEPPAILDGNLHWVGANGLVVFDTGTLQYRWMMVPPEVLHAEKESLLELDGLITISVTSPDRKSVQLWVLHDYNNEGWLCKFNVLLVEPCVGLGLLFDEDHVLSFISQDGDVLAKYTSFLHLDTQGNELARYPYMEFTRHMFRPSLMVHYCLDRPLPFYSSQATA